MQNYLSLCGLCSNLILFIITQLRSNNFEQVVIPLTTSGRSILKDKVNLMVIYIYIYIYTYVYIYIYTYKEILLQRHHYFCSIDYKFVYKHRVTVMIVYVYCEFIQVIYIYIYI